MVCLSEKAGHPVVSFRWSNVFRLDSAAPSTQQYAYIFTYIHLGRVVAVVEPLVKSLKQNIVRNSNSETNRTVLGQARTHQPHNTPVHFRFCLVLCPPQVLSGERLLVGRVPCVLENVGVLLLCLGKQLVLHLVRRRNGGSGDFRATLVRHDKSERRGARSHSESNRVVLKLTWIPEHPEQMLPNVMQERRRRKVKHGITIRGEDEN